MKKKIFYIFVVTLFIISCGGNNDNDFSSNATTDSDSSDGNTSGDNSGGDTSGNNTSSNDDWLIPVDEVKDGGPGKDGIPSVDSPKFVDVDNANFLDDDDLVIGVVENGIVRAYPHKILNWHEIVNDNLNDESITINYCPLTGTAFGWGSFAGGSKSTFGVSGLLYNANLILYDRNTDSYWSQLELKCVNGTLIGELPKLYSVVETNWGTWKKLYPNTKVLSLETGFSRNYEHYPYGDYNTNHDFFIFTPSPLNDALPNKERVHAILENQVAKVYQFERFSGGKVLRDFFEGKEYLVVGNENLLFSFELATSQLDLDFEYDFNNSEVFFKDNEGNKWSVFGEAIEGPRTGHQLKASKSVISYWFAIAAFYPKPKIYFQ